MASNFIKKKAEESRKRVDRTIGSQYYGGSEYISQTHTANGNVTRENTTGGKTASNFIKKKAEESRKRIDQTIGSQHYGGSKYMPQRETNVSRQLNQIYDEFQSLSPLDQVKKIAVNRLRDYQPAIQKIDVSNKTDMNTLKNELDHQMELKNQYVEKMASYYVEKMASYAWAKPNQKENNNVVYELERDKQDYQTIVSNIDQINRKINELSRRENKASIEQVSSLPDFAEYVKRGAASLSQERIQPFTSDYDFSGALEYITGKPVFDGGIFPNTEEENARYAGLTQEEKDTILYLIGAGDQESAQKYYEDMVVPELEIRNNERLLAEAENAQDKMAEQRKTIEDTSRMVPDFNNIVEEERNRLKGEEYSLSLPGARATAIQLVNQTVFNETPRTNIWTQDELDTLLYLLGSGDEKSAERYYDLVSRRVNQEYQTEQNQAYYEMAKDNKLMGTIVNLSKSFGGIPALGETIMQNIENALEGTDYPVDIYAPNMEAVNISEATEQGITEDMGEFGQFLASTGLSMGRMAVMLPFGQAGSLAIMTSDAAGRAAKAAAERGATAEQALGVGIVSGAIEFATEKLPIDNLFRIAKGGKNVTRNAVKEILKQAGIEGTEELVSEYANTLTDIALMGEKSEYQIRYRELLASGMSAKEAKEAADMEFFVVNPILSFAGGSLSGGVFSSGAVGLNAVSDYTGNYRKQTETGNQTAAGSNQSQTPTQDMGESGQKAWAQISQNAAAEDAAEQFDRYYKAGKLGIPQNKIPENVSENPITPSQAAQAYFAGVNDAQTEQTAAKAPQTEASFYEAGKTNQGLTEEFRRQGAEYGMRTEDLDALDRIAKRTGTKYQFDTKAEENGSYYNGTITINPDSSDPIKRVLGHELAHFTETSEQYEGLRKDVLESPYIAELLGEDIDTVRQKVQKTYQADFDTKLKNDPGLTREDLIDREVFAQAMGNLMYSQDALRYVAKKRPVFIQKAIDFLHRIGDALSGKSEYEKFVREVENRFRDALYENKQNANVKSSIENNTRYSLIGKTADGIEVYETSDEIKNLSYSERKKRFLDIMKNEYAGRTAKFTRNGHTYYAQFEDADIRKNIYGDRRSSPTGWRAKINVGAEGNIFELVENSEYRGSRAESGKNIQAHKGIDHWDYFIKSVQIDDVGYDVLANIRKNKNNQYVYSIQLNENKKIRVSPPVEVEQDFIRMGAQHSDNTIAQKSGDVNSNIRKNSENDTRQYSLNAGFAQELDEWLKSGKQEQPASGRFFVGTTSDALKSIDVKDYKIYWNKGKVAKIMEQHPEMTADVIKKVPDILEHPILVMQSQTVANRITLFGETMSEAGEPIMAAIELRPQSKSGEVMDFAVIASAYKRPEYQVQHLIDTSDILYLDPDKKRTDTWLKLLRLQLPSRITKYGSITNVTYVNRNVKGDISFGPDTPNSAMADAFQKAFEQANQKKSSQSSIRESSENDTKKSMTLEQAREKYGTIPPGENPARKSAVPKRMSDKLKNSFAVRTAIEAGITPEEILDDIYQAISDGKFAHEVYTDKAAYQEAERALEAKGFDSAWDDWKADVRENKRMTKGERALGYLLYERATESGDMEKAFDLLTDFSMLSTSTAQEMQAHRLLKKLSPAGQLMMLDKSVRKIQSDLVKQRKLKAPKVELNEKLAKDLLQSKTKTEMESAVEALKRNVADQVPATWLDKITAWRYMAMLGNPRTHIRNIVGNALFYAEREMKNLTGMAMEKFISKDQRTKALLTPKDKPLLEYAKEVYNENKAEIKGEHKYENSSGIENMRRIYKNKALEAMRKAVSNSLSWEDDLFSRSTFVRSFAQAMKARNLTGDTISDSQRDSIFSYAVKEAQKGTFQDASAAARALNRFKKTNRFTRVLGEGLIPFTKTPINILKRGVEYSPVGILKGIYDGITKVRNQEMSASEMIDELAAGMTGSAVMVLGILLSSLGLVTGGADEEKRKDQFEDLSGYQNYALNLGNVSYTLDWAAPAALPLFLGVEIQKAMEESNPGTGLRSVLESVSRITEPVFEMTMLQGVNSAIQTAAYSQDNPVTAIAFEMAENYAGQFIPSIFGQVARTIDPKQRNTYYTDKNSPLPAELQQFFQKNMAKIPFASMRLEPKIDQWGREVENGGLGFRALENFLSPGYASVIRKGAVDNELERLYDKFDDTSLLPAFAVKYFTVEGEKKDLTAKEYTQFAKKCGNTALQELNKLFETSKYKNLSDEKKADAVKDVYDYAKQTAKAAVSDYEIERKWRRQKESGIPLGQYVVYYTFEGDKESKIEQTQKAFRMSEEEAKEFYYRIETYLYPGDNLNDSQEKNLAEAKEAGFTEAQFRKAYNALRGVEGTKLRSGRTVEGSRKRNMLKALREAGFTSAQANKLYNILQGRSED